MARHRMLAGAPLTTDCAAEELTGPTDLLPVFVRFLGAQELPATRPLPSPTVSTITTVVAPAAWRLLRLAPGQLHTGLSQRAWLDPRHDTPNGMHGSAAAPRGGFNDAPQSVSDDDAASNLSDCHFEQSFALHEGGPSCSDSSTPSPTYSFSPSVIASADAGVQQDQISSPTLPSSPLASRKRLRPRPDTLATPPRASHLIPLAALPTATHLMRIQPQTYTADLAVCIITLSPPRRIVLRRPARERQVDLVEATVGDEGRAGLPIAFWCVPTESRQGAGRGGEDIALRVMLAQLRVGDVVLLRQVALRSWRGVVQGQSLGGARGPRTAARLLWRNGERRLDTGDPAAAVYDSEDLDDEYGEGGRLWERTREVRRWAKRFVNPSRYGREPAVGKPKNRRIHERDRLPDDTL